jgi:hypothetical protein
VIKDSDPPMAGHGSVPAAGGYGAWGYQWKVLPGSRAWPSSQWKQNDSPPAAQRRVDTFDGYGHPDRQVAAIFTSSGNLS